MRRTWTGELKFLPDNGIFVFGSNTQGRHGKGSAATAVKLFGAIYGRARGLQGRSYAIVTKDLNKKEHPSIPSFSIWLEVFKLYEYAKANPNLDFYVVYKADTPNLNGYSPQEMANIFSYYTLEPIPTNIIFEYAFSNLLKQNHGQTNTTNT